MLSIIATLLVGLVTVAAIQVPPAIDCATQSAQEQAQRMECPTGAPGRSLPGIPGPPGRDCELVQFPNKRYGCRYSDGTYSESDQTVLPQFQGLSPERFWIILLLITALIVGFGSWKLF
jgi:hypothetical protein